jgi:hypothetical protein
VTLQFSTLKAKVSYESVAYSRLEALNYSTGQVTHLEGLVQRSNVAIIHSFVFSMLPSYYHVMVLISQASWPINGVFMTINAGTASYRWVGAVIQFSDVVFKTH